MELIRRTASGSESIWRNIRWSRYNYLLKLWHSLHWVLPFVASEKWFEFSKILLKLKRWPTGRLFTISARKGKPKSGIMRFTNTYPWVMYSCIHQTFKPLISHRALEIASAQAILELNLEPKEHLFLIESFLYFVIYIMKNYEVGSADPCS